MRFKSIKLDVNQRRESAMELTTILFKDGKIKHGNFLSQVTNLNKNDIMHIKNILSSSFMKEDKRAEKRQVG